jgi:hypothetical protein
MLLLLLNQERIIVIIVKVTEVIRMLLLRVFLCKENGINVRKGMVLEKMEVHERRLEKGSYCVGKEPEYVCLLWPMTCCLTLDNSLKHWEAFSQL